MSRFPAPIKGAIVSGLRLFGRELEHDFESNRFKLKRHIDLTRDHWGACREILGRAPRHIFDVGANVGMTALELARRFPKASIHSYEPTPAVADRLRANVATNSRIHVHQCALGAAEGATTFHLNRFDQTNSVLPTAAGGGSFTHYADMVETVDTIEVQLRTVAGECARFGLDTIDLLKTDAQGYDLQVIEGAMGTVRPIPLIFTEACMVPIYEGQPSFGQFHDRMNDLGYRLVSLYEMSFRTHFYQLSVNALFMHESGPRPSR